MKIRNGFVSNSSSSSFILIAKDDNIKNGFYHKNGKEYDKGLFIDLNKVTSYNRGYIKEIKSVEDKITYICSMYLCNYYHVTDEILLEVTNAFEKIKNLCRRYGYSTYIKNPYLEWHVSTSKWDDETHGFCDVDPYVDYGFNMDTECCYYPDIKKMVDDEDTTRLEQFLFNPHSFGILGGDEFEKTYKLEHKSRQRVDKLGYEYERLADYPDVHHKKGDPCSWSESGVYEEDVDDVWGYYNPDDWKEYDEEDNKE